MVSPSSHSTTVKSLYNQSQEEEHKTMLKQSLESTQYLCIDWPDTTQSILDDEFLNQEDEMISNVTQADRIENESRLDLPLHSSVYTDLERESKVREISDEPNLVVASPESSCKTTLSSSKTHGKGVSKSCRRRKKPKGMPKRPLSAYNIFFQTQRSVVQAEAKKENKVGSKGLGFEGLGKLIGKQWKELGTEEKKRYKALAEKESSRYLKEMNVYRLRKKELIDQEKSNQLTSPSIAGVETTLQHQYTYPKFVISNSTANVSPVSPRAGVKAENSTKVYSPLDFNACNAYAGHPENVVVGNPADDSSLSFPMVPPAVDSTGNFLFPPGMEITLSDSTGRERKYKVEYRCYEMSRAEATQYIDSVAGNFRQSGEAHPSIPQSCREVPNNIR